MVCILKICRMKYILRIPKFLVHTTRERTVHVRHCTYCILKIFKWNSMHFLQNETVSILRAHGMRKNSNSWSDLKNKTLKTFSLAPFRFDTCKKQNQKISCRRTFQLVRNYSIFQLGLTSSVRNCQYKKPSLYFSWIIFIWRNISLCILLFSILCFKNLLWILGNELCKYDRIVLNLSNR